MRTPQDRKAAHWRERLPQTKAGLTDLSKRDTNTPRKPKREPVADNPSLWGKVEPQAQWRPCVTHGSVNRPTLRERTYRNGTVHLEATCPFCGCYLGNVQQIKPVITNTAQLAAWYMVYRCQAMAAGHRVGSAWHRFRHDFGRDPDPSWVVQPAPGGAA